MADIAIIRDYSLKGKSRYNSNMPEFGAYIVIDTLMAVGARQLLSLSGNQILALYDATIGRNIEIIHVR